MPGASAAEERLPRSVGILGSSALGPVFVARLHRRLPESVPVTAYSHDVAQLDELHAAGAIRAASPADLAARSEVVLVLLDELVEIQAYLDGPSGVHAGTHSPTTLVIGAVLTPGDLRRLGSVLSQRTAGQLRVVDAPLSGSRAAAEAGRLPIGVGCPVELFGQVEPLLSLLGTVIRVGALGSAQVAHASQQLVMAGTAWALAEAMLIAERSGVDPRRLHQMLLGSAVGSELLGQLGERMLRHDFDPDLPAAQVGRALGVAAAGTGRPPNPSRLPHRLTALLDEIVESGDGDRDLAVLYELLARQRRPPAGESGSAEPPADSGPSRPGPPAESIGPAS